MQEDYPPMTADEFLKKGEALFGADKFKWKFKCPMCGNIQTPEDFRQYKDKGATPDGAYQECIGRYEEGRRAFGKKEKGEKPRPCDYASYGLFRIGHMLTYPDGHEVVVFPFAEAK